MKPILSNIFTKEIGSKLYRYFQHKGAGTYTSDLVQDTLLRIYDKYSKFDETKGTLASFSFGFAHHIWQEHLRLLKKDQQHSAEHLEELIFDVDIHKEIEKLDAAEKLKKVLGKFPRLQQDILYFYFDEELTTKQIARVLDIPEGTIKSHLHRCKVQLKAILTKDFYEY